MNRDCLYSYPKDMCGNYLVGQGIASGDLCISESLSYVRFNSSFAKVDILSQTARDYIIKDQ